MALHGRIEERPLSAELRLAVECCRFSFQKPLQAPGTVPQDVDWASFARIVRFHRIEGMAARFVAENETSVPEPIRVGLSEAAAQITRHNLEASAACRKLNRDFEAAGVPLLFLKGLAVGALAYRTPMVKAAVDVDLLIDPMDLGKSVSLLRQLGYALSAPSESALATWHRWWKESVWTKVSPALQIDLHTRPSDNPLLIPNLSAHSRRRMVDVGNGVVVPTFADEELFAYLAVHGASSAWFRLKWISDFAGFLSDRDGETIDGLYRRSQELGAGRAAGQALLLADHLFGTLASNPHLQQTLLADRATRRLYLTALRLLTRTPIEPTQSLLGSAPIRCSQFGLLPGLKFKMSELSGQAHRLLNRPIPN